jgi:hypothetical protein
MAGRPSCRNASEEYGTGACTRSVCRGRLRLLGRENCRFADPKVAAKLLSAGREVTSPGHPRESARRHATVTFVPTHCSIAVGDPLAAIDTPALVVDLDALERNLDRMASAVRDTGVALRPHAKSHKCPAIALAQIARGAVGICCQKVGEAEAFVAAGVPNVLVTNEIVEATKLARLAALGRDARIAVLVDDIGNVTTIAQAARDARVALDVLVEIDVRAHRCGVESPQDALALARAIDLAGGRAQARGLTCSASSAAGRREPSRARRAFSGRARCREVLDSRRPRFGDGNSYKLPAHFRSRIDKPLFARVVYTRAQILHAYGHAARQLLPREAIPGGIE